jgi:pSer/pThr/pTyr-binding forkhead associated (FHA) protein
MIECRICRTIHIDNTLFCEECGNYLLHYNSWDTVPLNVADISWIGKQTNGHRSARTSQTGSPFLVVGLRIGGTQQEFGLTLNQVIRLGRMDPALNIFPEIDLSYNSYSAQFISRRHASIMWFGEKALVEDLASANGTFLNGKRLVPFLPETLVDGDMLQLARLLIEVKIKTE